jgi:hypothetical protein
VLAASHPARLALLILRAGWVIALCLLHRIALHRGLPAFPARSNPAPIK